MKTSRDDQLKIIKDLVCILVMFGFVGLGIILLAMTWKIILATTAIGACAYFIFFAAMSADELKEIANKFFRRRNKLNSFLRRVELWTRKTISRLSKF